MRILHLVPALFDSQDGIVGGAERYAHELARNMAELSETTLVTFGQQAREITVGKLRIRVLGPAKYIRGQQGNPFTWSLWGALRQSDVVHCHQQHILASSLSAAISRLRGKRVFVSDLGGGGWDISAYISTDRWYQGHLHISEYSRFIMGHANKPWAHVIYGGVDTDHFSPDSSVPKSSGTVLYVGRLLPHKGVDDLIRSLPPGLRLELIGRPYDRQYLADLQKLAEGKDVVFHHNFDDSLLVNAYRRAICLVLPSVYKTMYGQESKVPELLGQTLLEAMACGTPAICTQVASMPEVVDHEVTGFVVPPNNPELLGERLAWLAAHPAEASRMGQAGRERVMAKFRWPVVARHCLELYGN